MWNITKEFDFCYGHRVWNQTLDPKFSIDSCLVCRHLHGHQGKVIVELTAEELTSGMVTDFKHLNWFKKWIDDTLDHKFIIDRRDPLFSHLFPHYIHPNGEMDPKRFDFNSEAKLWTPRLDPFHKQAIYEMYEGLVVVEFVPTSEAIAAWLFNIIQARMQSLKVQVRSVEFKETPKTSATFKAT